MMKNTTVLLATLIFFVFSFSQNTFASEGHMGSGNAIHTMAGIMMHLNHHPSSAEKSTLKKIAENSRSEHEKTIAHAMINMQHRASSADKVKLKAIMNDSQASNDLKTLAEIVHNLSHQPSRDDKHKLQTMMN